MVPPRRTIAIAEFSAASRSTPAFFITARPTGDGRNPAAVCAAVAIGEPCASMPTASMTESAPRPWVELAHDLDGVVEVHVDDVAAQLPRALNAVRHHVDADHMAVQALVGHLARHRADRAEAEDHQRSALRHVCVLHRLPRGRQHIGQVDVAFVGPVSGTLMWVYWACGTRRYSAWPPGTSP